ncbi:MAG: caspase family protein [Lewinellaceae bacterium]|nr:caspase family protein [Saprospiraceae bacterium]MCB9331566.1 caspase family protein [Lewinellaceae bacterium]
MKYLILLATLVFLVPIGSLAQIDDKGATPVSNNSQQPTAKGTTRAVVVGISDYQQIPDLQYADKDAKTFADWLRSPAGGSLPEDNIKLLLNENATKGKVVMSLYWLTEESQEGDQAIIFFSGHGDIEVQLFDQLGFLLCWDALPYGYMAGGTLELNHLQSILKTLTITKKSRVLLITDACRSGKLAGAEHNGPGITTANLAHAMANTTKLISCEQDEVSIEGPDWGGGHGAFSYHLIDGLYGLADLDTNREVTVLEARRYLEDHVTPQVAPIKQTPQVIGSNAAVLAAVDPAVLKAWKDQKAGELSQISAGNMRGIVEDILAEADSAIQQTYADFLAAIERKELMVAEDSSRRTADVCFELLIQDTSIQKLHGHIKRTYVAALVDEGQQYVNKWMLSEIPEIQPTNVNVPGYMAKAASILGESHYLYKDLKAKEYFFKAVPIRFKLAQQGTITSKQDEEFMSLLDSAYTFNKNLPVLYALEAAHARTTLKDYPRAEKLYLKSIELVPTWAFEYAFLAQCYASMGNKENAFKCLEKALKYKPNYYTVYWSVDVILYKDLIIRSLPTDTLDIKQYIETSVFSERDYRLGAQLAEYAIASGCAGCSRHYLQYILSRGEYNKAEFLVEKLLHNIPDSMFLQYWDFWPCAEVYLLSYEKTKYLDVMGKATKNFVDKLDRSIGDIFYSDTAKYLSISISQNLLAGNYNAATQFFNKLKLLPNTFFSQSVYKDLYRGSVHERGLISYILGNYMEAEQLFSEAMDLDSSKNFQASFATLYDGPFLIAFKKGDYETANFWFNKMMDACFDERTLYHFIKNTLELAIIHQLHDEALYLFESAAKRFPDNPALKYHTGGIQHYLLNRPKRAIQKYKETLKISEDFHIAYYSLAQAYLQIGRKSKAFNWLELSLKKRAISKNKLDTDPLWDPERNKPRFTQLLQQYFPESE